MVGVTKIGRGNAKYWIEAVAEGGEDYYTKPGERPGEWIGELAPMTYLAILDPSDRSRCRTREHLAAPEH